MSATRILICLFLAAGIGCKAQTTPTDKDANRRIENRVRAEFNVPPEYTVTVGEKTKSDFPGYFSLPITFSRGAKQETLNFLLSSDGKTLARLESFDLSKDPGHTIATDGRPERGGAGAKVVIVNFDDLECPFCAKMHRELFPATLERYHDQVKVIYKDYPLIDLHPWAMRAAVDSNCLAQQSGEGYWKLVDYVHEHGEEITGDRQNVDLKKSNATLDRLTKEEGQRAKVDAAKLDACIAKQDEGPVRASMKEGEALHIDGTPMLFVNGERLSGAVPVNQLWTVIDRALMDAGVTPPAAAAPSGTGTGGAGAATDSQGKH